MIGNIPEKDMAMLEERIKRSSKNRPVEPEPIGMEYYTPVNQPYIQLTYLFSIGDHNMISYYIW